MASGSKVSYARVVSATTTSAPSPSKTRPNPEAAEVKKPVEETKPAPSVEGQPQKKESADDDGGGEWHTVDTKAAKKQKEEQHPPPRVPKGENSGPRRREGAVSRRFSERPPEKGSSARFPREKHAPDHHASSSTPSAPVPHSNGPHRTPVANGHQNVVAAPDSDSDCGKAAAGDANNLSASSSVSSTNSQPDKPKLVEAPVPKVNPWARKPSSVPTTSQPATRDESPQKVAVAQTTNSSRRPAENSPSTVVRAKPNEVAGKRGDRLDAPPARKERAKTNETSSMEEWPALGEIGPVPAQKRRSLTPPSRGPKTWATASASFPMDEPGQTASNSSSKGPQKESVSARPTWANNNPQVSGEKKPVPVQKNVEQKLCEQQKSPQHNPSSLPARKDEEKFVDPKPVESPEHKPEKSEGANVVGKIQDKEKSSEVETRKEEKRSVASEADGEAVRTATPIDDYDSTKENVHPSESEDENGRRGGSKRKSQKPKWVRLEIEPSQAARRGRNPGPPWAVARGARNGDGERVERGDRDKANGEDRSDKSNGRRDRSFDENYTRRPYRKETNGEEGKPPHSERTRSPPVRPHSSAARNERWIHDGPPSRGRGGRYPSSRYRPRGGGLGRGRGFRGNSHWSINPNQGPRPSASDYDSHEDDYTDLHPYEGLAVAINGIPTAPVAAITPAAAAYVTAAPFVATVYFNPQYAYPNDQAIRDAIRKQIEYYFSEENLQRDFFLRRRMDGEGYLPLELIASFQRVQNMTQDINLVIAAIKDSETIELKGRLIRTKKNPEVWPIRDASGVPAHPQATNYPSTESSASGAQPPSVAAVPSTDFVVPIFSSPSPPMMPNIISVAPLMAAPVQMPVQATPVAPPVVDVNLQAQAQSQAPSTLSPNTPVISVGKAMSSGDDPPSSDSVAVNSSSCSGESSDADGEQEAATEPIKSVDARTQQEKTSDPEVRASVTVSVADAFNSAPSSATYLNPDVPEFVPSRFVFETANAPAEGAGSSRNDDDGSQADNEQEPEGVFWPAAPAQQLYSYPYYSPWNYPGRYYPY